MRYGRGKKPVLYASEIGMYHYCPVSWYLKRCGYQPYSLHLKRGVEKHYKYGSTLKMKERQRFSTRILIISGILGLLLSVVLFILEMLL